MATPDDNTLTPSSTERPHADTEDTGGAPAPFDPFVEIVTLARTTPTRSRYMAEVLQCIGRFYGSPYAALHIRYASEVIQDDCHYGPTDPNFWKPSLQPFLTESLAEARPRAKLLRSKTGQSKVAFLSAPIFDPSGPAIGAVALVVVSIRDNDVTPYLARLEALARLASFAAGFLGITEPGPRTRTGSSHALGRAAQCESAEELAFAITNELRNKLGCEQVCLGFANRNRVKVVSVSGLDEVRKQSPGVVCLRSAMGECLDAGAPIVFQKEEAWSTEQTTRSYRLHKQWHAAAKGDAVASIPLRAGDAIVAVLSLRSRSDRPFAPGRVEEIRGKVEPFAPALVLAQRASRGLLRHVLDSCHSIIASLITPGRLAAKFAAAVATALLLWFCFGSMDYDLAVPCTVTAAEVRHVSAPFDGVIASSGFVEGNRVSQGNVLCELDHVDLDQQKAQLLAELSVWERTMDRARATESPVEVQLALANQQLVQAKLDIVNRQLEQATLEAPFDGVIVSGDLRKRIGGVVARGDPLFEIAPLDRWTLQLDVPESSAAHLKPQLAGTFASYARPEKVRTFRVSRVLGAAEVRDSRNVYVTEADISAEGDWMRPGMEGIAKIRIGPRPVWWIALHRVIDYVRINFWL
jgi:hypothetical protein